MGANWGCERKGDAAATCTVQRAHSSTAVPLAGCGTSLSSVIVGFFGLCPWVATGGAFMPVCSTGGASAGANRAAAKPQPPCGPVRRPRRRAGLTIVTKIMRTRDVTGEHDDSIDVRRPHRV